MSLNTYTFIPKIEQFGPNRQVTFSKDVFITNGCKLPLEINLYADFFEFMYLTIHPIIGIIFIFSNDQSGKERLTMCEKINGSYDWLEICNKINGV